VANFVSSLEALPHKSPPIPEVVTAHVS
jgi:hypothetical protein